MAQRSTSKSCQQLSAILPILCSGAQLPAAALTRTAGPSGRLPGCRLCPQAQSPCTISMSRDHPRRGSWVTVSAPCWPTKNARHCRTSACTIDLLGCCIRAQLRHRILICLHLLASLPNPRDFGFLVSSVSEIAWLGMTVYATCSLCGLF